VERVEILMATRDGAQFLPGQLDSIAAQTCVDWQIVAGDDGSRDATPEILDDFAARSGRLRWRPGPGAGSAANFLSLIARPGLRGYTALSDQDDIWERDRLARAVSSLGPWDAPTPRIYASRTILIDRGGTPMGLSTPLRTAPLFRNALVQNLLPGNTIVMNAAARDLLRLANPASAAVPFHDWWICLLLTGAGAEVVYDPHPGVRYRQHDANLVGAHRGARASARRVRVVARGIYGDWLRRNCAAIAAVPELLRPAAKLDLARFCEVFDASPLGRIRAIARSGAARQTRLGNLCVFGAAALGRL